MKHFFFKRSVVIGTIFLLAGAIFIFSGEDRMTDNPAAAMEVSVLKKPIPIEEPEQNVFNWSTWTWHETIQDAINNASTGNWLILDAIWFEENVLVNRSVIITGDLTMNHTVYGGSSGDVFTITAPEVTIKWLNIRSDGNHTGIKIESNNNVVRENIIRDCYTGVKIESDNNVIYDNDIQDCAEGIGLYSRGNVVTGNIITNSQMISILLYGATENWLYSNTVTGISEMDGMGIFIGSNSNANFIYANIVQNHNRGIFMSSSSDNIIHRNNLLDNYTNAVVYGYCPGNKWYHELTSVGNYWSDYSGADQDGDGIIDSPYYVPYGGSANCDQYPLVNQWQTVCGNVNGDPKQEITIGDISYLIDYLSEPIGTPELMPPCVADVNDDGLLNEDDRDYLIDYLFNNGPEPNCCSKLILPFSFPLPPL